MPDIHWHVGEDKDQETIAYASSPRRLRRSWIAVLIVVVLGAGPGMASRSIPSPTLRLTPTSTLPVIPAKLYEVIDREARALADGDRAALRDVWNFTDLQEQRQQISELTAWGTTTDRSLYDILSFGLLSADSAWVEIRQYRNGDDFRETRFYRLQDGQWWRTEANPRFWRSTKDDPHFRHSTKQTADTMHFHAIFAVEDRSLIMPILTQLEQDYEQICADFDCPTMTRQCVESLGQQWCSVYSRKYRSILRLNNTSLHVRSDSSIIELPSPRITGIYESSRPVHYDTHTYLIEAPLTQVWHLAYGTDFSSSLFSTPPANSFLAMALTFRELEHLQTQHGVPPVEWYRSQPNWTGARQLESLWLNHVPDVRPPSMQDAYWFLDFLEQEFGKPALAKLLQNMQEPSPYKALQASTGIPFAEVQQRWTTWLKARGK